MDVSTVPYVGKNYCDLPNELKDYIISFMDANDRITMKFVSKSDKERVEKRPKIKLEAVHADSNRNIYKIRDTLNSKFVFLSRERFIEKVRQADEIEHLTIESLDPPHDIFVYEPSARYYLRSFRSILFSYGPWSFKFMKLVKPSAVREVHILNRFNPQIGLQPESLQQFSQLVSLEQVYSAEELNLNSMSLTDAQLMRLTGQTLHLSGYNTISASAINQFIKSRLPDLNVKRFQLYVTLENCFETLHQLLEGIRFRLKSSFALREFRLSVETPFPRIELEMFVRPSSISLRKVVKRERHSNNNNSVISQ